MYEYSVELRADRGGRAEKDLPRYYAVSARVLNERYSSGGTLCWASGGSSEKASEGKSDLP